MFDEQDKELDSGDGRNPVDVHVGICIRARRIQMGLSQSELGEAIGVTFQQVQKYERGYNRVSASVLYSICIKLQVSISYFFNGYEDSREGHIYEEGEANGRLPRGAYALLNSEQGLQVAEALAQIKTPQKQRLIIDLIKGLASN